MFKETAYQTLERVAAIEDVEQRKVELRRVLEADNVLAIVVQRTYHPNYNFDLPTGVSSAARKSNHDSAGPFMQSVKKWNIFRKAEEAPEYGAVARHIKEQQFVDLYESVSDKDADLLIGVKDKKLPWDNLSAEFVVDAIPEMFPADFRPGSQNKVNQESPATNSTPQVDSEIRVDTRSAKDQCLWIMENNPGLKRKEYIELFEKIGVKPTTAALYYQNLKSKVTQ